MSEYRRAPLTPSQLEEHAAEFAARHAARLKGLDSANRAQLALKAGLQAAMETEEREVGVLGMLINLFVEKPQTPLVEALTVHHEAAVQQVRALGHQIEALETDRRLLNQDIQTLNTDALDAMADAQTATLALQAVEIKLKALTMRRRAQDSAALQAEADQLEAQRAERSTEHRRFFAAQARLEGLAVLNRELRQLLNDQHERLCELHDAGTATLKRMASHLATLKAAASARDLNRETESALRDLRSSVARVCRVADESSHYLTEHVDELEARMRTLDAEAASRREAHAEVEAALDRVRRWQ